MKYPIEYPYTLLGEWLKQAETSEINDPNAVYIATVDGNGQPSVRTVLLKGLDNRGPVIYTNTRSRKGQDMANSNKVALLFHWKSLEKQVRVEGKAEFVSNDEADIYFSSRSRESQIGAHASLQSQPLAKRAELETRFAQIEAEFQGKEVTRPAHWTGYRVLAEKFEFWEAGNHRLHDREILTRTEEGWTGQRLYP